MSLNPQELTEDEFNDYIEELLVNHYGEDNVARNKKLDSDRIPDFIVETKLGTAMVQAESSAEAAIKGKAQVELYAAHNLSSFGVVLYPQQDEEEDLQYFGDAVCFMQYEFKPDSVQDASLKLSKN